MVCESRISSKSRLNLIHGCVRTRSANVSSPDNLNRPLLRLQFARALTQLLYDRLGHLAVWSATNFIASSARSAIRGPWRCR